MQIIRRNLIDAIVPRLAHDRAVVVTGARQTGKTTLCDLQLPRQLDRLHTYISFDDPDDRLRFQAAAVANLEALRTPLVILDEVQKMPSLLDPLKLVIDRQKKQGFRQTFFLTGSSQLLLLKGITETLSGRIALFHLYPFSLSEAAGREGTPLLSRIWQRLRIDREDVQSFQTLSAQRVRTALRFRDEHLTWGGYPPVWHREGSADRINWLKDYRKTYLERDISDVGQVANINTFALAQKLLCARTANVLSISEVARDLSLAVNTVKRYINLLAMTFQCFLLPPFFANVGKRFVKSPKIFFSDVGLIKAILGEIAVNQGALYENWVFSELVKWKQLQAVEPELYFYRTSAGMEIDFLIAGERRILPAEVKSHDKVSAADGRSIESFLKEHKTTSPLGLVVYKGRDLAEIRKNIWAVPDWYLFGGL